MKFLLIVLAVLIGDRVIPYGLWGFYGPYAEIDEVEYMRRYGLFAFPRTLLGVCACMVAGLNLIIHVTGNLQSILGITALAAFCVAAGRDAWLAKGPQKKVEKKSDDT